MFFSSLWDTVIILIPLQNRLRVAPSWLLRDSRARRNYERKRSWLLPGNIAHLTTRVLRLQAAADFPETFFRLSFLEQKEKLPIVWVFLKCQSPFPGPPVIQDVCFILSLFFLHIKSGCLQAHMLL